MDEITISTVRCGRCPKRFDVIDLDHKDRMQCPHCKGEFIKHNGQWYDIKVMPLLNLTTKPPPGETERRDT